MYLCTYWIILHFKLELFIAFNLTRLKYKQNDIPSTLVICTSGNFNHHNMNFVSPSVNVLIYFVKMIFILLQCNCYIHYQIYP